MYRTQKILFLRPVSMIATGQVHYAAIVWRCVFRNLFSEQNVAAVVQVVWMSVQLAGGATVREQSGHRRQEGSVEERTRYTHANIL